MPNQRVAGSHIIRRQYQNARMGEGFWGAMITSKYSEFTTFDMSNNA